MSPWRVTSWLVAGALVVCAGCIGPHYTKHPLVIVKKKPPEIHGPHDPAIEANLATNLWSKGVLSSEFGVGNVIFKSMGISGWKDYHIWAKARGVELQHQIESSGMCTVDIRLYSLTLDDTPIPINGTNFMRVEIFLGRVAVDKSIRHQTNNVIIAEGKFVWDSDGWFEIHPQKTGDVRPEGLKVAPGL